MASQPGADAASKAETKPTEEKALDESGDVPDPDEDDLDDLDDLLDDFSAVNIELKKPELPGAGLGRPPASTSSTAAAAAAAVPAAAAPAPAKDAPATTAKDDEDVVSDDDFARQLSAGMAELMGNMDSPEMQAQFESLFKDLGAAAAGEPSSSSSQQGGSTTSGAGASAAASAGGEASFQETIRRTMERMQASGDQATAAAAADSTTASDDFLAELLKQMQSEGGGLGGLGGEGGGGAGGEEELSKMLLGMMEQLTNKDILYEPMKELDDKFPEWMARNAASCPEEDRRRYERQQGYVREIVARFEEGTYSDANPADREYIVDRMQKMQDAGSPPADLVGNMPSAQDALGGAPDLDSCNPQ